MNLQLRQQEETDIRLPQPAAASAEGGQAAGLISSKETTQTEAEAVAAQGAEISAALRRGEKQFLQTTFGVSALLLLGGALGAQILTRPAHSTLAFTLLIALGIPVILAAYLHFIIQGQRKLARKVKRLAETGDPRVIGPLLDAFLVEHTEARKASGDALTRLLPTLTPEDSAFLDATHRARMNRILSVNVENNLYKDLHTLFLPVDLSRRENRRAVDLRLAILAALPQVGDRTALPVVERLAAHEAKTPAEKEIQAAARVCLPRLQERLQLEQAPATLLRPASAPGTPAETLLRPACGVPETDPNELLRPALGEEK